MLIQHRLLIFKNLKLTRAGSQVTLGINSDFLLIQCTKMNEERQLVLLKLER